MAGEPAVYFDGMSSRRRAAMLVFSDALEIGNDEGVIADILGAGCVAGFDVWGEVSAALAASAEARVGGAMTDFSCDADCDVGHDLSYRPLPF